MRSKLAGRHRLLFAGEVDCVEERSNDATQAKKARIGTEEDELAYVELKTSRVLENERQESNFVRFKVRCS